jgi:outer membrane biosynthesis protein TonB
MKPTTRIAIAGLLSSAGAVLTALAAEFGGALPPEGAPSEPTTAEPPAPAKPKKQKAAPVVEEKPAEPAAETEKPAEPAAETEKTEEKPAEPEAPVTGGKTYEELKALIEPLVKGGQGAEVKKLIAKYDPESSPSSIKTMPAKNHAAFEKDIEALGY